MGWRLAMKTIFCPNTDNINESIQTEITFLHEMGIETYDFKDLKKSPWRLISLKCVNLNWYDDINISNKFKSYLILIKKMLTINLLKLLHIKIIYTLHNKIAHDGKSDKVNLILKKYLLKKSDTIAILSKKSVDYINRLFPNNATIQNKTFFVGHPLYITHCLNEKEYTNSELIYLFYGMVRPYKNIELLIAAWKELKLTDAKLMIVGKPISNQYKEELLSIAKDVPGMTLQLEYIDNRTLDEMIQGSHVIISPLNVKSSLNSGTLIKAMCMKKTIIMPDIEMTYDYDINSMYVYHYNNAEEHKDKLKLAIQSVYYDFFKDPDLLKLKGQKLYESNYRINNNNEYKKRYYELYFENGKK